MILKFRKTLKMSHLMRKPTICICENKGADQLRGNREADQRLCFRYSDSTIDFLFYLNPKFQASISFLCLYRPVCVGPVRKPHCWFFHDVDQMVTMTYCCFSDIQRMGKVDILQQEENTVQCVVFFPNAVLSSSEMGQNAV